MKEKKIVIIGGGGHACVLMDILKLNSYSIYGYIDVTSMDFPDIKYLGNDEILLAQYQAEEIFLVNGIGSAGLSRKRCEIYKKFKALGYRFLSVIHPKAVISSQTYLGEGVQIMAGVVINPRVRLEENVIINTSASVDHDSIIGAHTHVAPGVTICGNVTIDSGCHIGVGAKIIQGICITKDVFIRAGEIITQNRLLGAMELKELK